MQVPPSVLPPFPRFNGVIRTDFGARAAYSEGAGVYRIVPAAVAIPSTTESLRELVQWAAEERVPLIPRGAGSGMTGGNLGPGVVVDLSVLDGKPLELHSESRYAVAGAAVTRRMLDEAAGRHGLRFPPDPSSGRFATLGGMLSTNASGPASVRAGSVRRWVRAIEMVTADGELLVLRRGTPDTDAAAASRFRRDAEPALRAGSDEIRARTPRIGKNSSGYALAAWLDSGDLLDLIVGAEGTLGIITSAEWALERVPPQRGGLRVALSGIASLGELVSALLPLHPSAVEYLDATFLGFVGSHEGGAEGLLMVEFEGSAESEVRSRVQAARELVAGHASAIREGFGRHALESLWDIRHAASPMLARLGESKRSMQVIEDGCVPLLAMPRYIEAVREASRRHRIPAVIFGHAGEGNLHVNLLPDLSRPDWEVRVGAMFEEVTEAVVSLGGSPSGEHGDGRLRGGVLERVFGAEMLRLMRTVKTAFDPHGILNPGIKLDAPTGPGLANLKAGPHAAVIPPRVEAGLREIERNAGYAISRLTLADERGPE